MEELGFAHRLSLLRKERGMSQKAVAEKLHISQALLSHYEKGIREPGLDFVIRAAKLFGVTTDFLLGISDLEEESPEMKVLGAVCSLMDDEQMRLSLMAEMYCILRQTGELPELFDGDNSYYTSGAVEAYAKYCRTRAVRSSDSVKNRLEALKTVFPDKFKYLKEMLSQVEHQTKLFFG